MDALTALWPMLLIVGFALVVLPASSQDSPAARIIGSCLVGGLLVRYLIWRGTETLPDFDGTLSAAVAYGFFGLELTSSLGTLLLMHVLSRTVDRSDEADRNPIGGNGIAIPLVDVFIPTFNEGYEILERTIIGAMAMDYPDFRVWVLDDGNRPWLRDMAQSLGANYLSRAVNINGKAGNMNNGLAHVVALPNPPDVIAILDADFVPVPWFLRRAATLLHDPGTAVVQTPQHFFNQDPIQMNLGGRGILPDEQRFFFDVILASRDAHGTTFSCGTSALVRVEALRAIGGFPTESVTEDMLLSIKVSAAGYRTVYLNEALSAGLAAEGMHEYRTQRGRWCMGTLQIQRTQWGFFGRQTGVPLRMRLHTLEAALFWAAGSLTRVVMVLLPIFYWWFGLEVMNTDLTSMIFYLGPFWTTYMIYIGWISRGTIVPILADAIGSLIAFDAVRASMIGLFGSRHQKFKVTAKGASRDVAMIHWPLVRWFLLIVALTVGGIVWRLLNGPLPGTTPSFEVMHLWWSLFNVLALLLASLMCIDQPRSAQEMFATTERAEIVAQGAVTSGMVRAISPSSCVVDMPSGAAIGAGTPIELRIGSVPPIQGVALHAATGRVWIMFAPEPGARAALIRKLFSGLYVGSVSRLPVWRLLGLMARRALG